MNILIVHAHPEPTSLTRSLVNESVRTLQAQGHEVALSDLYAMRWKAVFDEHDFPVRKNPERLCFIAESGHAYSTSQQTADVQAEQRKLLAADAVIFQFPLWWFGMPAILKGWVDRVFAYGLAYGYRGEGNRYRYGAGGLQGRRALLSVMVGGPAQDYGMRGINGPLEQLLFPITHGMLFFAGMDVLPSHAIYSSVQVTAARFEEEQSTWRRRLERLFDEAPIAFRRQNDGDYPDGHVLADLVAVGQTGIMAHIAEPQASIPTGIR